MDRAYWDSISDQYDARILDAVRNDREGVIRACIEEHGDASKLVADFGCGIGKTLRLLAKRFSIVDAYDLSGKNIAIARHACRRLSNIRYHHTDLAAVEGRLTKVHFAVSINVLLTPSYDVRNGILKRIGASLRPGGRLLLVVPSLESALYSDFRLLEWNLREGFAYDDARIEGLTTESKKEGAIANGIVTLDGVPTKHYLCEELQVVLRAAGLAPVHTQKVEYGWGTEFDDAPRWMRDPYPWDWMVLAEKA